MPLTEPASVYRPRHAERTVVYRLFEEHFERYVQEYEERYEAREGLRRRRFSHGLTAAVRAAYPRETALQPAAGEVGLDGRGDDLAQRSFPRLVAFLVFPDVTLEVLLEQPVADGALGVAGAGRRQRAR